MSFLTAFLSALGQTARVALTQPGVVPPNIAPYIALSTTFLAIFADTLHAHNNPPVTPAPPSAVVPTQVQVR